MKPGSALNRVLMEDVHPLVPFTTRNTVWRSIDKRASSILDLGCGTGVPMRFISKRRRCFSMGVDIYETDLRNAKARQTHRDYALCDLRRLPFKSKSFDVVLCLEAIEHLEKAEGLQLLNDAEAIARKQVILSTPVGRFRHQPADDNVHQEHLSGWQPAEFRRLGYRVRGYGLPLPGGNRGFLARVPEPLQSLRRLLWLAVSPVSYVIPEIAGWMVCVKTIGTEGRSHG